MNGALAIGLVRKDEFEKKIFIRRRSELSGRCSVFKKI